MVLLVALYLFHSAARGKRKEVIGALVLLAVALWRARTRPTDRTTFGLLAALALDGLGQDVEDFRHLWIALGLADAGRRED